MIVEIENIGLFEYAKANMAGLTVLAGVNDTGKSTLGKVVFSVIYGLKEYKVEQEAHQEKQVSKIIEELFFLIRRNGPNTEFMLKPFTPKDFIHAIKQDSTAAIHKRIHFIEQHRDDDNLFNIALKQLNNLQEILKDKTEKELMMTSVNQALNSEFESQINSLFNDKPSKITFSSDIGKPLVTIDLQGNKVLDLTIEEELFYSNVTLIDSPIVIQLSHLINTSAAMVPLHWRDLNKKLVSSKYQFDTQENPLLAELIGGQVEYNEDMNTFSYNRKVNHQSFDVRAINVASGIKSLSILNLLISSGQISISSFLIIDEPEVNLHPQWQIEYAKVISSLAAQGVTILVTTHSPYIIEALKTYEQMDGLKADFLLSQKSEVGIATIENHTNDVAGIINSLAAPLDQLHQLHIDRSLDDL
jgi:predicted ATPase